MVVNASRKTGNKFTTEDFQLPDYKLRNSKFLCGVKEAIDEKKFEVGVAVGTKK